MSLLEYFPKNFVARTPQVDVINRIDSALKNKKKFIVINAPTGFGKSMIPKTIANYSKKPSDDYIKKVKDYTIFEEGLTSIHNFEPFGCFNLTITKNLQDQYLNDFIDAILLKGKMNYQCNYDNDYDVEDGPCITSKKLLNECWGCNRCDYYNTRNDALLNQFSILNYSVYLNLPDELKVRQFLVCDEASELEDEIVKRYSVEINYDKFKKAGLKIKKLPKNKLDDQNEIKGFISNLCDTCEEELEVLKPLLKVKNNSSFFANKIKYKYILNLRSKIVQVLNTWNQTEYIIEEKDKTGDIIEYVPLRVDKLANNIYEMVDHVILMSATIIDHKKFCKDLGIYDYEYIESPSCFDAKKSPIKVCAKWPLTYDVIDNNLGKVVDFAKKICESDNHKNQKGIIHTNSFKITNAFKDKLSDNRYLYREDNVKNEDLIDIHKNTNDPTVLISPSMTHGVDLKGKLGEFQIIAKIPYPSLASKRIKRLAKEDFNWYNNKALSALVQACGRCTRTSEDEAITYIIDGSIEKMIKKNKYKFPKFFLERFS